MAWIVNETVCSSVKQSGSASGGSLCPKLLVCICSVVLTNHSANKSVNWDGWKKITVKRVFCNRRCFMAVVTTEGVPDHEWPYPGSATEEKDTWKQEGECSVFLIIQPLHISFLNSSVSSFCRIAVEIQESEAPNEHWSFLTSNKEVRESYKHVKTNRNLILINTVLCIVSCHGSQIRLI